MWVPEEVCERVAAAADIHGTAKMKPVFTELRGEVSYDHIRLVFFEADQSRDMNLTAVASSEKFTRECLYIARVVAR